MERPKYEVILRLHEDDNGIWGLCHDNAVGTFDAFWSADGVFHDVFEHYFEGQHRYFSGQYMYTIYGEMAASGAAIALSQLGIDSFRHRSYGYRDFTADTWYSVEAAIDEKYIDYPIDEELCRVPKQKQPTGAYDYYSWLAEYEYKLNDLYERLEIKKKPIKMSTISKCYAWGYKQTQKLIKSTEESYRNLDEFLKQWHRITNGDAKSLYIDDEMAYGVHSFKFKVHDNFKTEILVIDDAHNEYPIETLEC